MSTPYTWPELGTPNLRRLIRKFNTLPLAVREKQPLWAWILQGGTPFWKFYRSWVGYSPLPVNGQCCGNCNRWYTHNVTGTTLCDSVRGVWKAEEHCQRWTKPWDAKIYRAYQEGDTPPASEAP